MEDNILQTKPHVLIVGGGIFGLTAAIILGEEGYRVTLIEKRYDVMLGASLVNQNRIHYGYHYPRSKQTAKESLLGLNSFTKFYGKSINDSFDKYYAIAKRGSHTSADEFVDFCEDVGLELKEAFPDKGILDRSMVEACWLTPEPIFDFHKLKQEAIYRIHQLRNVRVIRNTEIMSLEADPQGTYNIKLTNGYRLHTDFILNTTYSGIPDFAEKNKFEPIKGKIQLCVMPILESLKRIEKPFGVTVMDGPFCSLMPKGFNNDHFILYHVVHSVVQQHIGYHSIDWAPIDGFIELEIMEHSKAFYPCIDNLKLRDSWISSRIVLPDQELDDARPTKVIRHAENVYSIFSGKLTTCVEAGYQIVQLLNNRNKN